MMRPPLITQAGIEIRLATGKEQQAAEQVLKKVPTASLVAAYITKSPDTRRANPATERCEKSKGKSKREREKGEKDEEQAQAKRGGDERQRDQESGTKRQNKLNHPSLNQP